MLQPKSLLVHRRPGRKDRLTSADGIRETGSRSRCQTGERKGLQMTLKERLEVHRQIVAENERKLKEWKEGRK